MLRLANKTNVLWCTNAVSALGLIYQRVLIDSFTILKPFGCKTKRHLGNFLGNQNGCATKD